jgi:REP element-mobilizing transposase RayT
MNYLITFSCYGSHLHGSEIGSVDRGTNVWNTRRLESDFNLMVRTRIRMVQDPYLLDGARREVVLEAIREVCDYRGWTLQAAHIRSTHVHAVVRGEVKPERIMNDFKIYASRRLNRAGFESPERRRWTRHGSTRWLFRWEHVIAAVRYVVEEQGEPMSVFVAKDWCEGVPASEIPQDVRVLP